MPWAANRVTVSNHAQLHPVGRFTELLSVSIGPAGEAVGVWTDQDGRRRLTGTKAPSVSISGAVTITTPNSARAIEFDRFRCSEPVAQPMPDGRVLLVDRWATWHPTGPDHNVAIYSSDGDLEHTACVGDGIQHVRATRDGHIWLGYHDMGIHGSNDWSGPGLAPIGAAGLLRFTPGLKVDWEYPGSAEDDDAVPTIDDCEALTLAGDTVWAYPYLEYPLVQVTDGRPHVWYPAKGADTAPAGVQMLAVASDLVGLVGGYEDREAGHVALVDLKENQWSRRHTVHLALPDGNRLNRQTTIHGLGDTLHIFDDTHWYLTDLTTLTR